MLRPSQKHNPLEQEFPSMVCETIYGKWSVAGPQIELASAFLIKSLKIRVCHDP